VDEDILVMGKGTNKVEIDLMQPIDPERAPKVHVPTLNHIGLWVDDLHKAVDELTALDVRFTPGGIRKGAGNTWRPAQCLRWECYIALTVLSIADVVQLGMRLRSSTRSPRPACS
jgi:hypothetical protein